MAEFTLDNLKVDIDDGSIIYYVMKNFNPEDVFPWEELHDWAVSNYFVYEGK